MRFKITILKFYYSLQSLPCLALLSREGLQEKNVVEHFLIENMEFLSKVKTENQGFTALSGGLELWMFFPSLATAEDVNKHLYNQGLAHTVVVAWSYFISISVQINKAPSGQLMPEHLFLESAGL